MSLDLSYGDELLALQASVDGFCRRAGTGPGFCSSSPLPEGFWSGLADLGVLGLGTQSGGGGVLEIAAVMETLGAHGAPGPLVGTFAATALLDDAVLGPVKSGDSLVSVGAEGVFPWAPVADVFLELGVSEAWRVQPAGPVEPVDTTAGEPWARMAAERLESLGDSSPAAARASVAVAAYMVGAADELVSLSAEYARNRMQFNKAIATFQAVSHPLASAATRLNASRILVRGAAQRLDAGDTEAAQAAALARLSATAAATDAAYRAHQLFGAMGFTLEGPVAFRSHRIRQVGLLAPSQGCVREVVAAGLGL
ncbi:acyl-CoA dehydrogenase family protein [Candidatus Poriferisocius sp.]|uniref:acyl-CoA dehydrogenase family protein n=1 Tax=Candidatus Poriferisocius sp. TaxID=3101276 RepID=UPI003B5906FF